MKLRPKVLVLAGVLALFVCTAMGANSPIDKSSIMISGAASFTSMGGDLYKEDDSRVSILTIQHSYGYFIAPGFHFGLHFQLESVSAGGTVTTFGLGPKLGYIFGANTASHESRGKVFPHVGASFVFKSASGSGESATGSSMSFSGGILYMIANSAAVDVEAVYQLDSVESVSGNQIGILAGLTLFIFK